MFPTRTLLKLLAVLEEDLSANHFAAGRFHLWPAMRFLLATRLQDNDQSKPRTDAVNAAEAEIEKRFERLIAARPPNPDLPSLVLSAGQPTIRSNGGKGLLLVSRAEDHYMTTPGGLYAPVIDPWADISAGRWPCLKAELANARFSTTQPRKVPTTPITHESVVANQADITERDAILRAAKVCATMTGRWLDSELGVTIPDLGGVFAQQVNALWADKQIYRHYLRQTQPGLVITSCYYFRPTLGVVWAARELGIPVADAQHGGNGEFHIGYTHWRNAPDEGYLLLPDYFLVWDNISANNILRWLPPGTATHQVPITGRFGLGCANRAALGEGGASPIAMLKQGGEKTILVTLQTLPSTGLTDTILEVMRRAPKTWTWLVRGHPIAQAFGGGETSPDALEAKMKAAGIARYDAKFSTSLPLAAILPQIDHHLTGFSGTVQECAAYDIRTTFTHPTFTSFFSKFVDVGAADFAATPGEILASIAAEKPFPDLSRAFLMPRDEATAADIVAKILQST